MNQKVWLVSAIFLSVILVILMGATTGLAQQSSVDVRGEPDLEVYIPSNTVSPGTTAELSLQIDNNGELARGQETNRELVTTARNVVVEVDEDDAPIEVNTGRQSIGSVSEQQPTEVPLSIDIPDDAEPGTYEIEIKIEYSYTSEVRVGSPNESDFSNQRSRSVTRTVEIEIDDAARFRVTDVESTLRVGEEGAITGNLTNIGGEDVTNAEVQFATDNPNIVVLDSEIAVGDIDAGDSAPFRIPVEATSEAEAVTKRFDLPVSFRDENGIRAADEDPEFLVEILEKRDEFTIDAVERTVTAGETTALELEVTNNRDQTVTDIEAKLFADDPLDSDDDEAFIESLEPGESTTVVFDLSAAGSATAKTYPVSVDFRYDDERGRSKLSDSYRVAIDVTESEDGGLPTWLFGIGLLGLGGIGYAWYRRQ